MVSQAAHDVTVQEQRTGLGLASPFLDCGFSRNTNTFWLKKITGKVKQLYKEQKRNILTKSRNFVL